MRVCVVGAGAAGLCAARHLAGNSLFEFVVYEQAKDIGGTWVYDPRTGLDENGLEIHSAVYQNLRTNLPGRIMNFPDFMRMGNCEGACCLSHNQVLEYLHDYTRHYDLRKYIQFNTKVENIRRAPQEKWSVRVINVKTHITESHEFEAIIVCNGHYFESHVPSVAGAESFRGRMLHSHSYRRPDSFSGHTVFILGAASSGIDIACDLAAHASRVYLSHEKPRIAGPLPPNTTQLVGVQRIQGNEIFLRDGSSVAADDFIYCTGYRYSFPFLDESCGIRVDQNHVTPLHKHLINADHPTMCFVGIPASVLPFPMFHMQVQYFLALLKGNRLANLSLESSMLKDSTASEARAKWHFHKLMDRQWEYNDELSTAGGFPSLPTFYRTGYDAWHAWKEGNLLEYKNSEFVLADDGNVASVIPLAK